MEIKFANELVSFLAKENAKQIETYNITEKTNLAKYLVLATVSDELTARELVVKVKENFENKLCFVEGEFPGDWIVIDFGDVVVELFKEETREKYNLEKLWGSSHNKVEETKTTEDEVEVEEIKKAE